MSLVAKTLEARGVASGVDLVARIGQQGANVSYKLIRLVIQNGPQTDVANGKLFRLYAGTIAQSAQITAVSMTTTNDAQFIPPEDIPAGVDLLGVWEGQSAYTGVALMTATTDGGNWQ